MENRPAAVPQGETKRIGFIVNPVAGIGGKVGLKGSDGSDVLERALALGGKKESGEKALVTMRALAASCGDLISVLTYPGEMGEEICQKAGLPCAVFGSIEAGHTTPRDTVEAAVTLSRLAPDLIVFAGGDGTARNILDAVGTEIPVIGIPTGCKIHSGVYALNPKSAAVLIERFVRGSTARTKEAEVMDINEELFRQGVVEAKLYGYLRVPLENKLVQNQKSGRARSEEASLDLLANYLADQWDDGTLYLVGSGSTTAAVMKKLGLPNTLLGVDAVYDRKVVASDCSEKDLLELLPRYEKKKILITVIGGQGYLFGRGNQQLSASVIRAVGKENILVTASESKITALFGRPLYVDTGDEETNAYLKGYIRVIVGYERSVMMRVSDE